MEGHVERERRERGVTAEDAGGEEQPPMLRGVTLEGEVRGEQSHRKRAGDVLEQRGVGKRCTDKPREGKIDAVPQRCPEPTTEEDNQKAHRRPFSVATSTLANSAA